MLGNDKDMAGIILAKMKPKKDAPDKGDGAGDDEEVDGLESAAEDLIKASKDDDAAGVATALRAAFDILRGEPEEEEEAMEKEE